MFRAAVEIMREHKAWGYERREVEGAWSGICRRGHKGRDTLVVTQPMLAAATSPQIELLFDGLAGFERHVVITAAAPDAWTLPGDPAHDLGRVLERWAASARKPERVHVLVNRPEDRAGTWAAFGRTVGFGTASLSVADLATQPTTLPRPAPAERRHRAPRAGPQLDRPARAQRVRRPRRRDRPAAGPPAQPSCGLTSQPAAGQCGCQASSSAVREVTALGSRWSDSCWIDTASKTSRSERRAAIHTCCSTSAVSL